MRDIFKWIMKVKINANQLEPSPIVHIIAERNIHSNPYNINCYTLEYDDIYYDSIQVEVKSGGSSCVHNRWWHFCWTLREQIRKSNRVSQNVQDDYELQQQGEQRNRVTTGEVTRVKAWADPCSIVKPFQSTFTPTTDHSPNFKKKTITVHLVVVKV